MKLRLPIPIFKNEVLYSDIEIEGPRLGVIADAKKVVDTGDRFSAIVQFISGCTSAIYKEDGQEITDKVSIKSLVRSMPYRSAEYAVIKIMLLYDPADYIEGIYTCPKCGFELITGKIEEDGEIITDNRDRISDLRVVYCDGHESIEHTYNRAVTITSQGEILEAINNFEMDQPTLLHCINAAQKYSQADEVRLQCGIYVEAITKINGLTVENQWKNRYGMLMFDGILDLKNDARSITEKVNKYGIEKRVPRICTKCGKEWKAVVNTSNFFDFDLQPM